MDEKTILKFLSSSKEKNNNCFNKEKIQILLGLGIIIFLTFIIVQNNYLSKQSSKINEQIKSNQDSFSKDFSIEKTTFENNKVDSPKNEVQKKQPKLG